MTFEPVKSGSNMASYRADQEGHYSIFRRLIWEHKRCMVLIYGAQTLKWTTGERLLPEFCVSEARLSNCEVATIAALLPLNVTKTRTKVFSL